MKILKLIPVLLIILVAGSLMGFDWGERKTLKELADSAPVILVGQVQEVKAQHGEYLGRTDFIYTYVQVAVQMPLKGADVGQRLTVKVHGGQIGDLVIAGDRSFRFSEGEEVLLFLTPVDHNYYEVYSMSGKLSVVRKEDGAYFDTSMLKGDDVSSYGVGSRVRKEAILNRINGFMSESRGERK